MKKRFSAFLLAALMVAALLPTAGFADVQELSANSNATFNTALATANGMSGEVTIKISGKVEYSNESPSLTGAYDKINFVGVEGTNAEISITRNGQNGYISGNTNDCAVTFTNLILSKPAGFYANDAGFMNMAFTVYRVGSVEYTDCQFPNGACAAGCPTTYTGCTFEKSHDKYAMWAYGSNDIKVDECVFDDDRGIKMYAEGAAKTTTIEVTNSDFSKVSDKPAIVLTYGNSITLEGNTYSDTGILELEDNGSSNGATVVADVTVTCVSDAYPNGCGVLVGDKIYRTVSDAAAAAQSGDTVTLLHSSTETVKLPDGVQLDENGFTAENVEGDRVPPPAYAGPVMNWVKVNTADNGVVKSGPLAASAGATVTLYPKAAEGFVLDTVEVLDAEGNAVALDGLKFAIPAGGVTVNATFKLAE